MKRSWRGEMFVASLIVLTILTYLLTSQGTAITVPILFWVIGLALLLPLLRSSEIDWFEPLWLFLVVYFLRFWLRPFLAYLAPGDFGIPIYLPASGDSMVLGLVAAFVGLIAFYVGYYIPLGPLVARILPSLSDNYDRPRLLWFWGGSLVSFVLLSLYFLDKSGFSVSFIFANRGFINQGDSESSFFIQVIAWFAVALAIIRYREEHLRSGANDKFSLRSVLIPFGSLLVAVSLLSIFGSRGTSFFVVVAALVLRHFCVGKVSAKMLLAIGCVMFVLSGVYGFLRGAAGSYGYDVAQLEPAGIVQVLGQEVTSSYPDYDFLSSELDFYPSRHDFYYGQLALESVYWLIPRRIWDSKPTFYGGVRIQADVLPYTLASTDYGPLGSFATWSPQGEGYADFGWPGVVFASVLLGVTWRIPYEYLRANHFNPSATAIYAALFAQIPVLSRSVFSASTILILWAVALYVAFRLVEISSSESTVKQPQVGGSGGVSPIRG